MKKDLVASTRCEFLSIDCRKKNVTDLRIVGLYIDRDLKSICSIGVGGMALPRS